MKKKEKIIPRFPTKLALCLEIKTYHLLIVNVTKCDDKSDSVVIVKSHKMWKKCGIDRKVPSKVQWDGT